ncbi:peptide chain release factor N(5)-glutamine methyltransferase [Desulfosporosinus sp. BG]|uniref:peptide chain release factor N(5)-glutamine methyltransferase n=1 Tax=Desulfosporosinus sp. BG TaxID=1633135 RepID=UPI000839DEC6|nr:peptide chain release factor N(5)-glutamine methyltransferase [Desulfosporosinus sp. BG]ODA42641.1 Protein-N(5)-glutamine methyltransferase PrmC, methylates polypeptide chain release factors RF1 and RF2 [Desulfosporosinus sp. BG]
MKVLEGMHYGEAQLLEKGIENARLDADLLLAEVLGVSRRDRLYFDLDRNLSKEEEAGFREVIIRRAEHEPLQYILKRQDFMGLCFSVDKRVLIPRSDSEILVEKWLEIVKQEERLRQEQLIKVADLCTGSGALAISMAYYYPKAEVVGTDLSPDALDVARQNAVRLGVTVQWRQGDFVTPIQGELWDFIITNPPYVSPEDYSQCAPEIFREPSMAFLGGQDGLTFYRRLSEEIRQLLTPQGKLLMEIGWNQAEAVCRIFQMKGFETQVFPDLAGRDRVILAR